MRKILLVHSVSAHYGIPYSLQNCIDIKDNLLADVFKKYIKTPVFKKYMKTYQYSLLTLR